MQFYQLYGRVPDEKPGSEEGESSRGRSRVIARNSRVFNANLRGEGFFFVSDLRDSEVKIGIIADGPIDLEENIKGFLKLTEIDLSDPVLEEITFHSLADLLSISDYHKYIRDDEEVLESFGLNGLRHGYSRGLHFTEGLIDEGADKGSIYEEASKSLIGGAVIPELDRIFCPRSGCGAAGHPVHYMIRTDSDSAAREMYSLILEALLANGRIESRRVCFLDLMPGEGLSDALCGRLYNSCAGGTVVVRYRADDDYDLDQASGSMDDIEALCRHIKKYRNEVLTVLCLPREASGTKTLISEHLGSIAFVEIAEEAVTAQGAREALEKMARENHIRSDRRLFSSLEDDQTYLSRDLDAIFDEWFGAKLRTGVYPQYKDIAAAKSDIAKAAPRGSAYEELMGMVGLSEAKKVIDQILSFFKAQKLFSDKGMKRDLPCMHMVFTGNPGTAKTTVARLFAGIMRDNGLLSRGKCVEAGRADLVGKYVGWTAPMIRKKFQEAEGSVLFIDEAYSLADGREGSYGDEAINAIVQEMENRRDRVVVIFAGYPDKIEAFLNRNPGLRSRIAFHIHFDDYDAEELCSIAGMIAKEKGLSFTKEAVDKLAGLFAEAGALSDFGNGRYARNVVEKARMAQASRLLAMDHEKVTKKDVATILPEDIVPVGDPAPPAKKSIGFVP